MSTLRLRQVDALVAQATRALGCGQRLSFSVHGELAELTLLPLPVEADAQAGGVWLDSAVGALCLSDAEALLSLLGDTPLTLQGEQQAWYWQFFNQHLNPTIAALLAPIEPLLERPATATLSCRIQVRLTDQSIHARAQMAPETLLRLLQATSWEILQRPVDETWTVTTPLVIGEMALTLAQLASLRPGDVLLPAHCRFDSRGQGHLTLAGQHWAAQADTQTQHLFLQLGVEEHRIDEH